MASIEVIGAKELQSFMASLPVDTAREVRREIKSTSQAIETDYKRNTKVHIDTGDLDESIEATSKDGWLNAEIGSKVDIKTINEAILDEKVENINALDMDQFVSILLKIDSKSIKPFVGSKSSIVI